MKLDWYALLRDVLLLLILWSAGFWVTAKLGGGPEAILATVFVTLSMGFCLSGCLVRRRRFVHLSAVTAGVWIFGLLVGVAQGGIDYPQVLAWMALIPVAMVVGGAISLLLVPTPSEPATGEPIDPPGV